MGKFLIALAWLFFVQDPIATPANQLHASGLLGLGEIDAGAFNHDPVPADSMQESGVGAPGPSLFCASRACFPSAFTRMLLAGPVPTLRTVTVAQSEFLTLAEKLRAGMKP